MSNIQELVEQGKVESVTVGGPISAEDDRLQAIDVTAVFAGRIILGREITIEERARVGSDVILEDEAYVGDGAYLGDNVHLGSFASVDAESYVESGVKVGSMAIVGAGSLIAAGVKVPEDADLCEGAVVSGPYMIRRYGPVGPSEDFYTIYPGDEGPYICVDGKAETVDEFEQRMSTHIPGEVPMADDDAASIRVIAAGVRDRFNRAVADGDVDRLHERYEAAMGSKS